jgi:hypothetical protein
MPIPTAYDGELAGIEDAAAGVMVSLRTMQRSAPKDLPRLRQQLQAYVDAVMTAARDVEP